MESHQDLGKRLDLFFIDETSPGSIFWKPRGALLFNNLVKIIRDLYDTYGYTEVVTPNMYEKKLWETSGHWDKYRENMFLISDHHHTNNHSVGVGAGVGSTQNDGVESSNVVSTEKSVGESSNEQKVEEMADIIHLGEKQENMVTQIFSLKAMNCPGHCLVFRNMRPYSKQMPIRLAEFGVLHRNETSGSLHGLTRVRRFQQDDAHIFCRVDQIHLEVLNTLKMIERVYKLFDLEFSVKLSTRPEKYIGTIELWDRAEKILENVIKEFSGKSKIKKNIGDGAFYGPKIDITLIDKYKRAVQCGTVQLDFNLPSEERFDLSYTNETDQSKERPVIVHRAVLGSVERFVGIILEHTQGRLPIQVSPYPITVITVHKEFNDSANALRDYIHSSMRAKNVKLQVDIDDSTEDIKNKVKTAEKKGYCYIVTVGKDEAELIQQDVSKSVIAVRKNKAVSNYQISDLLNELDTGTKLG